MRKIPSILLTIFLICCALGSYGQNNTATRNYRSGGQYQYGKYGRNQSNYSLWDRVRNDLKEEAKKTKQEIDNNKDTRDNKARSKTVDTNESKDKEKGNQSNQDYSVGASEIELVVNGEGPDKTTATQNALRSAIEQAYGVFVSANTTILNDELVRDEIATVSSGNIKAYKELASTTLPDGRSSISLSAIVTISKLISYVQAHGGTAEFAGQTFLMNMRMQELNKKNEATAMKHLYSKLINLQPNLYDITLDVVNPHKTVLYKNQSYGQDVPLTSGYCVPLIMELTPNDNLINWLRELEATLSVLSLNEEEINALKQNEISVYSFGFFGKIYYLRNLYDNVHEQTINDCVDVLNAWYFAWLVELNDGERFYPIPMNKWSNMVGYTFSDKPHHFVYIDSHDYVYRSEYSASIKKDHLRFGPTFEPTHLWNTSSRLSLDFYFLNEYLKEKKDFSPFDKWHLYYQVELFFPEDKLENITSFSVRWNY